MADALRKSGIDLLGDVPWGTHFCQFYHTKQDLVDVLVPYFTAGLADNEFCMWVTSEPLAAREARRALVAAVPDLDARIRSGQMKILSYDEWYTLGGSFDADRVLRGWVAELEAAAKRGFQGLRLTGNTFWLERPDWDAFTDYEEKVNGVIGLYPMLALCTYSLDRCDGAAVVDVVKNHQFAMIKDHGRWDLIESAAYKKTKQALAERTAELEAVNEQLEAFSYTVSHDLRAPVRAMDGFARVLLDEHAARLDEAGRHHLERIHENAVRMGRLIDDILSFSRTSRCGMTWSLVDMRTLAREVFDEVRALAPEQRMQLRLGDLPSVRGDRAMLRQVLFNLVANAAKFSAMRAETRIEIDGATAADESVFTVRDNGVGFDMRYVDKLFGIFERLHPVDAFSGSGIGLAIVKRIVARHGGRVWAEGKSDAGAAFSFALPTASEFAGARSGNPSRGRQAAGV